MVLEINNKLTKVIQVWFNKVDSLININEAKFDVIEYKESHLKLDDRFSEFKNGIIELDKDLESIFAKFNKGFRNEVRRAGKEKIDFMICNLDVNFFNEFFLLYKNFCSYKNIQTIKYDHLRQYLTNGNLIISKAFSLINEQDLQYHLYFKGIEEVTLLASFPSISYNLGTNIIGYANRGLHWFDIEYFKSHDVFLYNLGGMGNPITEKNEKIVKFKMEMSPQIISYYNMKKYISLRAKLLSKLR